MRAVQKTQAISHALCFIPLCVLFLRKQKPLLSPPYANKVEPDFVCFFFYPLFTGMKKGNRKYRVALFLTVRIFYLLTVSFYFHFLYLRKNICLSAGKERNISRIEVKINFNRYPKVNGKKENPCLNVCIVRTSEQGFYAVYFREDYGTMPNEKANSEEKKSQGTRKHVYCK